MKKLRKFLGYAFCLTAVLTAFSSCLSNDNDDDITITERYQEERFFFLHRKIDYKHYIVLIFSTKT